MVLQIQYILQFQVMLVEAEEELTLLQEQLQVDLSVEEMVEIHQHLLLLNPELQTQAVVVEDQVLLAQVAAVMEALA